MVHVYRVMRRELTGCFVHGWPGFSPLLNAFCVTEPSRKIEQRSTAFVVPDEDLLSKPLLVFRPAFVHGRGPVH